MGSSTSRHDNATPNKEQTTTVTDGARISHFAKASDSKNVAAAAAITKKIISEGGAASPAWPFDSSQTNYDIAKKEYSKSPVEKYVATAMGDELPAMRDDLIERKHSGEGFLERHIHAWTTPENWKVDPENDVKEKSDPVLSEQDSDSKDICK